MIPMTEPTKEILEAARQRIGADTFADAWVITALCPQSLEHPGEQGWYSSKTFRGMERREAEQEILVAPVVPPPWVGEGCPTHGVERLQYSGRFQVIFQWNIDGIDGGSPATRKREPLGGWK